jgi:hypothetical protein
MDGRWTIRVCACTVASVKGRGPALPTPCERERLIREVPVVPCDDAAMKRVAVELRSMLGDVPLNFHELAEMALRAAGGQDVS